MSEVTNEIVENILIQAKNLLKEKGWIQGMSRNSKGYCMLGAIAEAMGNDTSKDNYRIHDSVLNKLNLGCSATNIAVYNDTPRRTKEEVLQAFDVAIASCLTGNGIINE